MQIIPAIDLRGGKCVRLRQGDYADETIFSDDPAEMAFLITTQVMELWFTLLVHEWRTARDELLRRAAAGGAAIFAGGALASAADAAY